MSKRLTVGALLIWASSLTLFQNCSRLTVPQATNARSELSPPNSNNEAPDARSLPVLPEVNGKHITRGVRAAEFVDSVGVNTHAAKFQNSYADAALILQSLDYLGVSHVRDALAYDGKGREVIESMAAAGVKFDFVVSRALPEKGSAGMSQFLNSAKALESKFHGSLYAIEGLNEANGFSFRYNGDGSLNGAAAFQRYLYTSVKADSTLRDTKVFNLSLANQVQSEFDELGDLSRYSDMANSHIYTKTGATADGQIEKSLALARRPSPGNPLFITEIGHPTLESDAGIGASQAAQAKLTMSELLSAWENGARRVYLYELFDNYTGGAIDRGVKEALFGIFDEHGSPKIAATALRNMLRILAHADGGGTTQNLAQGFSLTSVATTVHAISFEKSGYVYDIAVWNDVTVRNGGAMTDKVNPVVATVIHLGHTAQSVRVYDPYTGLSPLATYTNVQSLSLPLMDRPLIVEVNAATAVQ